MESLGTSAAAAGVAALLANTALVPLSIRRTLRRPQPPRGPQAIPALAVAATAFAALALGAVSIARLAILQAAIKKMTIKHLQIGMLEVESYRAPVIQAVPPPP